MLYGIAVRMVGLMRLHKESTYDLPLDATPDQVVEAESARRTFWLIIHHEVHVAAGTDRPTGFSGSDITARLPCDEDSFSFGTFVPTEARCVLAGTAAQVEAGAQSEPTPSLFATLVRAGSYFGAAARYGCKTDHPDSLPPWMPGSECAHLLAHLYAPTLIFRSADRTYLRQTTHSRLRWKNGRNPFHLGIASLSRTCEGIELMVPTWVSYVARSFFV